MYCSCRGVKCAVSAAGPLLETLKPSRRDRVAAGGVLSLTAAVQAGSSASSRRPQQSPMVASSPGQQVQLCKI